LETFFWIPDQEKPMFLKILFILGMLCVCTQAQSEGKYPINKLARLNKIMNQYTVWAKNLQGAGWNNKRKDAHTFGGYGTPSKINYDDYSMMYAGRARSVDSPSSKNLVRRVIRGRICKKGRCKITLPAYVRGRFKKPRGYARKWAQRSRPMVMNAAAVPQPLNFFPDLLYSDMAGTMNRARDQLTNPYLFENIGTDYGYAGYMARARPPPPPQPKRRKLSQKN